jgi:hypothetical protein
MSGTSSNNLTAKKGKGRGSVNNSSRLAAFGSAEEKRVGGADWGRCDPRWIAAVVVAAASNGMEVAFSYSKDGGAHGLSLYDYSSGERVRLWFNGDAELDMEMQAVYEKLT